MTSPQSEHTNPQNLASDALVGAAPAQQQVQSTEDRDEIDPVWLGRVENIFHTYANDPHALAAGFSELKADYIQGRYDKKVKKASE